MLEHVPLVNELVGSVLVFILSKSVAIAKLLALFCQCYLLSVSLFDCFQDLSLLDRKIYGYELSMRAESHFCMNWVKACFSFKFERVDFHFL